MPELPEVDHFAEKINFWLKDASEVEAVTIMANENRYLPQQEFFHLLDQKINKVYRKGKYLLFENEKGFMVCHNAMSGFWDLEEEPWTFDYVEGKRQAKDSDVRVKFNLGNKILRFHDARMFGSLRFFSGKNIEQIKPLAKLGLEALKTPCCLPESSMWSFADLVHISKTKRPIKVVLMDQELVAGIGNIYAAEACWRAQIDPRRQANELSMAEYLKLYQETVEILQLAREHNLKYNNYLRVYHRKNCPRCKRNTIEKVDLNGRSTYLCPICQR